jgi:hypothetical protein
LGPRLELVVKPAQNTPSMATLDLAPRFANGDRTLPLLLQARLLFLQEDIRQQSQRPEPDESSRPPSVFLTTRYNVRYK